MPREEYPQLMRLQFHNFGESAPLIAHAFMQWRAMLLKRESESYAAQTDLATRTELDYTNFASEFDLLVARWEQGWGDTSLGFGGYAGQMMTGATTTLIGLREDYFIYHGGRLAYHVYRGSDEFWRDVRGRSLGGKIDGRVRLYRSNDG